MTSPGPFGGDDDPFRQMGPFGDMFRMLSQQQGGNPWEVARQFATSVATEGKPESNIDPLDRIQLEQLARVAELQVANATGLDVARSGRGITIVPVTRSQWVQRSTDAYRELLEILAGSLGQTTPTPVDDDPTGDPFARMLAPLLHAIRPMLLGMTAGSMLGHLAQRSFGQYDLPVPRPASDELLVVVPNLDAFGEEWSVPADDLRMWICLNEVANHAVLQIPHVRARLSALLHEYAAGFESDPTAIESQFGSLELDLDSDADDPTGMGQIQRLMSDPEVLLGAIRSPAQAALLPRLEALVAVVVGYVDWVMDTVGSGLIGSYDMLTEALRRRRVQADPSNRFVEKLLGLELSQAQYDRGAAFIAGVVERAGVAGLERLWADERDLPTPPEVDAPGLWLARIDLDLA